MLPYDANFEKVTVPILSLCVNVKQLSIVNCLCCPSNEIYKTTKKSTIKKLEDDLTHDFSSLLQAFVYLDPSLKTAPL